MSSETKQMDLTPEELAEVQFAQDLHAQGILEQGRQQARVSALAKLARQVQGAAAAEKPKGKPGGRTGRRKKGATETAPPSATGTPAQGALAELGAQAQS